MERNLAVDFVMAGSVRGNKGSRELSSSGRVKHPSRVLPLAQSGQWHPAARNLLMRWNLIKNEKGLSLLEVVIAIALIGIVAVAVSYALTTASRALFIADERATAESLARSQMEYIKDSDYIDYAEPGHGYYEKLTLDGYSINITAVPVPTDPLIEGRLQKITVYIYHPEEDTNPLLTLDGYKRGP